MLYYTSCIAEGKIKRNNVIISTVAILINYYLSWKEITHFAEWPVYKLNVKEISVK